MNGKFDPIMAGAFIINQVYASRLGHYQAGHNFFHYNKRLSTSSDSVVNFIKYSAQYHVGARRININTGSCPSRDACLALYC